MDLESKLFEEYKENLNLYRHHDDIIWRATSLMVPAFVLAILYGLRQEPAVGVQVFIASGILILFWWGGIYRLRGLMNKSRAIARMLEQQIEIPENLRLMTLLYPEEEKHIIRFRVMTNIFACVALSIDIILIIAFALKTVMKMAGL